MKFRWCSTYSILEKTSGHLDACELAFNPAVPEAGPTFLPVPPRRRG